MTMAYENEITSARSTSEELPTLPSMEQPEEYKVTTSDVIILDEDAYSLMDVALREEPLSENFTDKFIDTLSTEAIEELIRTGYEQEAVALDDWLKFRVKNELITQMFTRMRESVANPFEVDTAIVKEVVSAEIETQHDQTARMVDYLEETLYSPATAQLPQTNGRFRVRYSDGDVDNLERRRMVKSFAIKLIENIQNTGEDGLLDLAKNYIGQTEAEAYREATLILAEQKKQLEKEKSELVEQVVELQEEVKTVRSEIQNRDMQLLDSELEDQLTAQAKDLAL
jgi:hypothetical protein